MRTKPDSQPDCYRIDPRPLSIAADARLSSVAPKAARQDRTLAGQIRHLVAEAARNAQQRSEQAA
jgi:hypothetical protein